MRLARILPALMIAVQLVWLAAPGLCHSPLHTDHAGGHGTHVPAGAPSCVMPTTCAAPLPAAAAPVRAAVGPEQIRVPAGEPQLSHSGDPLAPPVPPPQA